MKIIDRHNQKALNTIIVFAFFLVLIIAGVFFHNDYGLHWDSMAQYEIGKTNIEYVLNKNKDLKNFSNRYYGPIFEMFLFALTGNLPLREMFFWQHLITNLIFLLGLFCFYSFTTKITSDWRLGLISCLMIVLNPRIFAHSFYNTKDIPFMSLFMMCVFTMNNMVNNITFKNTLIHSITSAILMAIRLHGVLIIFLTATMMVILLIKREYTLKKILFPIIIYLSSTILFVILFFPVLWENPISEFLTGLRIFNDYPWLGGVVLYRGLMVNAQELPWHYAPVWILITTPIVISGLLILGGLELLINLFKGLSNIIINDFWFYLAVLWLGVPIIMVIILKSVLYDGWRHLFFIYPAYVLIAIYGLKKLLEIKPKINIPTNYYQAGVFFIFLVSFIDPVFFVIKYHPFEYVYFNKFAGSEYHEIKQNYEMDYWGLSYLNAFQDLINLDNRKKMKIMVENDPGDFNLMMLTPDQRERFIVVDDYQEADYFITNFRWHPQDYDFPLFHSIFVEGASINSIYNMID